MAMLTRWDPFRDLARLQDEMNRLFEDRTPIRAGESVGWTPLADVYEDDDAVMLRFELAGVDPAKVELRFENGVLTIKGDRSMEAAEKPENYHRVELSYGTFTRAFTLPATVDAEKIKAESKNGILTVTVPKRAETKPRSIQVKVN